MHLVYFQQLSQDRKRYEEKLNILGVAVSNPYTTLAQGLDVERTAGGSNCATRLCTVKPKASIGIKQSPVPFEGGVGGYTSAKVKENGQMGSGKISQTRGVCDAILSCSRYLVAVVCHAI